MKDERSRLIEQAANGDLEAKKAAAILGISEKETLHLVGKFKEEGAAALTHGNAGRRPTNATDEKTKRRIIELRETPTYAKASLRSFAAAFSKKHRINVSVPTISKILKGKGLGAGGEGQPKRRGVRRSASEGKLLCLFARAGDWLSEGRITVLHGMVDDATGRVFGLRLCGNECLDGYISALRQTLEGAGIPESAIAEREALLRGRDAPGCQIPIGEILSERIGMGMMEASGFPHAMRRARLKFDALQADLPARLKRLGVSGLEEANEALGCLAAVVNERKAVKPRSDESLFCPLGDWDLDRLLAPGGKVRVDAKGRFLFDGFAFKVESSAPIAEEEAEFLFSEKIGLRARFSHGDIEVSCIGMANGDAGPSDALGALVKKHLLADLGSEGGKL